MSGDELDLEPGWLPVTECADPLRQAQETVMGELRSLCGTAGHELRVEAFLMLWGIDKTEMRES